MRHVLLALALGSWSLGCGGAPAPETPPAAAADAPAGAVAGPAAAPDAPSAVAVAAPPAPTSTTLITPPSAAAPGAPAKRDPKESRLLGRLSEADVQTRIMQNVALFDPCLPADAYKKKDKTFKVQLKPTIGPSGKVNEVKVLKSSGDPKFDACVLTAFRKIDFPPSQESAFVSPTWVELGGAMVQTQ